MILFKRDINIDEIKTFTAKSKTKRHKKEIKKEWNYLLYIIKREAAKGDDYTYLIICCKENVEKLKEKGFYVRSICECANEYKVDWRDENDDKGF